MKMSGGLMNRVLLGAVLVCAFLLVLGVVWLVVMRQEQETEVAMDEPVTQQQQPVSQQTARTTNNGGGSGGGMMIMGLDEQNGSGQKGSVKLIGLANGKTQVSISLTGGNFLEQQPAHIHLGSCPKPGAVKYPLNGVVSNLSDTTLDISLDQLIASGPLALNIHKSASESTVYTACGNLPKPVGSAQSAPRTSPRAN